MATLLHDYNLRLANGTKGVEVVIVKGGKQFGGAQHYELRRNSGDYGLIRTLDPAKFAVSSDANIPDAIMKLVANSSGLPRSTNI